MAWTVWIESYSARASSSSSLAAQAAAAAGGPPHPEGVTFLGFLWIGFLGSFATLFLGLGRVIEDRFDSITSNPGIGVLIAAVIVAAAWLLDVLIARRISYRRMPLNAAFLLLAFVLAAAGGAIGALIAWAGVIRSRRVLGLRSS